MTLLSLMEASPSKACALDDSPLDPLMSVRFLCRSQTQSGHVESPVEALPISHVLMIHSPV